MKAVIYAGVGLFTFASVYGVADYYSSKKKGTLDNLYKEVEVPPVIEKTAAETVNLPVKKIETNITDNKTVVSAITGKTTKKGRSNKRRIRMEDFSRGRINEAIMPDIKTVAPVIEIPVKKEEVILKEDAPKTELKSAEPEKPRRKLSMEMFSRAPLKLPVGTTKAIKPVKYN